MLRSLFRFNSLNLLAKSNAKLILKAQLTAAQFLPQILQPQTVRSEALTRKAQTEGRKCNAKYAVEQKFHQFS